MYKGKLLLGVLDLLDDRHDLDSMDPDSMDPSMGHCEFLEMALGMELDKVPASMEILLGEALGKELDTEYSTSFIP